LGLDPTDLIASGKSIPERKHRADSWRFWLLSGPFASGSLGLITEFDVTVMSCLIEPVIGTLHRMLTVNL